MSTKTTNSKTIAINSFLILILSNMNNWKKLTFLFSLLLIGSTSYLQETLFIKGQVVDAISQDPLIAASVAIPNSLIGTISDEDGFFKLEVPRGLRQITISYVGYEEYKLTLRHYKNNSFIELKRSDTYLDLVTIVSKPPAIPLTYKVESVLDFSVQSDRILRLTKVKTEGYQLKLTDFDGNVLDSYSLKGIRHIEELTTSCLETHFLLTEFYAHQISIEEDKIAILYKDKRKKYDEYIGNCLDANSQYFYLNAKKNYEQISEITGFHRYLEEKVNFGQITDDFNVKNYKEERHYLEFMDNKGADEWINLTDSQSLEGFYDYWEKAALIKYNFYHPVNFYLHAQERSVFIMDHEKHLLRKFTLNGKVINQIPIQYSKERKWSGKIFKDAKTEKLYTYFDYTENKMLFEIDLDKGLLLPKAEIELSYVEDFQIFDDTIFFTNSGLVQGQEARILKRIDFGI
jgi:hypothetical protein